MAKIKYIDSKGEHTGTLLAWEYYNYAHGACFNKGDRVPYFSWQNTDYEPFKRAVDKKYNTTCSKAWLV